MKTWLTESEVECVVCPECAFTFAAGHTDLDGGYSCPACNELAQQRALDGKPFMVRLGRMCPVCLYWSEDDMESCPGDCDDEEGMPSKRYRIYREGVLSERRWASEPEREVTNGD